jgi:hypothetical protein
MAEEPTAYDQGHEAGRVAQKLEEHDKHFKRINGSIESTGVSLRYLGEQVNKLREESRVRDERVIAAAEALASETETRRQKLAEVAEADDRSWVRRHGVVTALITVLGIAVAVLLANPF